jgi:hypothetical protein
VAARSKAWTAFARSKAGIVGSNPNQGTDVCAFILCVGSGLATSWSPVQGVLPIVYRIETEKAAKVQQRTVEPWMDGRMDGFRMESGNDGNESNQLNGAESLTTK